MKLLLSLALFITLVGALPANTFAQDADEEGTGATQSVDDLRSRLNEVEAREAALQARVKQLEEDLKPENIERALAGVGSSKPEDLRESRKKEIGIELEGIRKQLALLATSRERLQMVISTAEAREYQQSADGTNQTLAARNVNNSRWLGLLVLATLTILAAVVALVVVRRRTLS